MLNNPWHNRTIPYNIKRAVRKTLSEAQKTFKAVLFKKTQLTSLSLLAGLMVVLMFSAPFLSVAQQKNPAAARAATEGEINAARETNRFTWFALGFIGGPITVIAYATQKPPPPAELLTGKSPAYVKAFTEAYETKAKSLRFRYATMGCFTGIAAVTLGYTLYDNQQYGNWWWETW